MEHTTPLISIIIPTFNRAKLISETLDSVLNQTYQNWECIVVDDGSTDNTEQVVSSYVHKDTRFQYHKRFQSKPKGGNSCRNIGFELSKGEYVCWLDSDDLFVKDKLEFQLNQIINSDYLVSVTQSHRFKNMPENITRSWSDEIESSNLTESLIIGEIAWTTASPLWKKKAIPRHPFSENLLGAQEWFFHINQTLKLPREVFHISEYSTVLVRESNQSMSSAYPQDLRSYNFLRARIQLFEQLTEQKSEYVPAVIFSSKRIIKRVIKSKDTFTKKNRMALIDFSKLLFKYNKKKIVNFLFVLIITKLGLKGERLWNYI